MSIDPKAQWNDAHTRGVLNAHSQQVTAFAQQVNESIPPASRILELGCGVGNDSEYFAKEGHTVTATDFSDVVIAKNSERNSLTRLTFMEMDLSQPLPFPDGSFDVVYARLSLHYFTDEVTKRIFTEIYRILSPGGLLCFMCKSTSDPSYGQGKELEKDMYEREGRIRHYFSEAYVKECLEGMFHITMLKEEKEDLYGKLSADIKVIAYKEE